MTFLASSHRSIRWKEALDLLRLGGHWFILSEEESQLWRVTLAFGSGLGDLGAKATTQLGHFWRDGEKSPIRSKELVMKGTCLMSPAWILGFQGPRGPRCQQLGGACRVCVRLQVSKPGNEKQTGKILERWEWGILPAPTPFSEVFADVPPTPISWECLRTYLISPQWAADSTTYARFLDSNLLIL